MRRAVSGAPGVAERRAVGARRGDEAPAASGEKEEVQEQKGIGDNVGDFVDYATGKAPIEHGKRIKRRFRNIQAEHNKRLEEAMGK